MAKLIDILSQVPRLNANVDFGQLDVELTDLDTQIVSRVNGLINLHELSHRMRVPAPQVLEIMTKLVKHDLVYFDDPRVADRLLGRTGPADDIADDDDDIEEIEVSEPAPRPDLKVVPPAEDQAAEPLPEPEATPAEPAPAPTPVARPTGGAAQLVDATQTGEWDVDSFYGVCVDKHREKATGVLRIYQDEVVYKAIYFADGEVVQVLSQPFSPGETLGRMLQRMGRISADDVVNSLRKKKQSGSGQGEQLVAMGLIPEEELPTLFLKQAEMKLRDVMAWGEGTWEFFPLSGISSRITQTPVPLGKLLFNICFKYYDFRRIPHTAAHDVKRMYVSYAIEPPFELDEITDAGYLKRVHEVLDEQDEPIKKLATLCKKTEDQMDELCWALSLIGMVEYLSRPRKRAETIV